MRTEIIKYSAIQSHFSIASNFAFLYAANFDSLGTSTFLSFEIINDADDVRPSDGFAYD